VRLETLLGAKWRASVAPVPKSSYDALDGVACTSARTCLLVGSSTVATSPQPIPLVVSGPAVGPWKLLRVPGPSGLSSIGCNEAQRCIAIGEPIAYSPHQSLVGDPTLFERTASGKWVRFGVPAPNGFAEVTLYGTACPPAGSCRAVGFAGGSPAVTTPP
jgi:hypothetical protein